MAHPAAAPARGDREATIRATLAVEEAWRRGPSPAPGDLRGQLDAGDPAVTLAALVKADLRCQFALGRRPAVAEYLERFPELRDLHDRVVSLVYEEYCLREEAGEAPDPDQFCAGYEPWRDSLESQLRYHRMLSQVAGVAPARPRFPGPGEHFLRFRLGPILGRGGDGQVYVAHDEELGDRRVALKVSPDRGREPAVMGQLDHPHIVPVMEVLHEGGTGLRGLSMPYRPGRPLHDVIRRVDPARRPRAARALWNAAAPDEAPDAFATPELPGWDGFPRRGTYADGVAWVVMTLARALAHAHGRGILHRDVKPANILLTVREGPQLLDFNLAHDPRAAAEGAQAARNGGTLPYMAPEQLGAFLDPDRLGEISPAADLYALGLVLIELLTGRGPEGPDPDLPLPRAIAELQDRRLGPIPSARSMNPTVPFALDAIAAKCLAPQPADRYRSAEALAGDLARFLDRRPALVAPNPSRAERLRHFVRRHRAWLAGGLVLAGMASSAAGPIWLGVLRTRAEAATKSAAPHIDYGLALESAGRTREARHEFEVADKLPYARAAYAQALAAHRGSVSALEGLGLAMLKAGRLTEADGQFLAARKLAPRAPTPLVGQGLILEVFGRVAEAQAAYDKARRLPGAAEAFARVAPAAECSARLHATLGSLLVEAGRPDDAREALRKAVRLDPGFPEPHRALALLDERANDPGGAFQHADDALKIVLARPAEIPAERRVELRRDHALYAFKWAEIVRNSARSTAEARRADHLYTDALEDLREVRAQWQGRRPDDPERLRVEVLQANVEYVLGTLAAADDPRRPAEHLRAAQELVDRVLAVAPTHPGALALKADLDGSAAGGMGRGRAKGGAGSRPGRAAAGDHQ